MSAQYHLSKYGNTTRLTLQQSIGTLIDNERFSDVRFMVGNSERVIKGHKMLFALSSDVFEQMFYGELKETTDEIRIPDLSATGFMNMVRFFYSKKVEIDLAEVYETVEAATKYMVSDLLLALHEFVMGKLKDASSACLLFEQLIKIVRTFGNEALLQPLPIDDLKAVIEMNCVDAFKSELFEHIDQETLIEILKFEQLHIKEIDLLKSCIRHVDVELKRLGIEATSDNKHKMFANVKNLIRFTDLNGMEFGKITGIEDYLSAVDISTIFLHLSSPSRPTIKYLSPRHAFTSLHDNGKKRKQSDDRNKPKRPLSAFFWYCEGERVKIKTEYPEYGVGDIAKELGQRWSDVGPSTKSKYVALAEKDKERYDVEMAEYNRIYKR